MTTAHWIYLGIVEFLSVAAIIWTFLAYRGNRQVFTIMLISIAVVQSIALGIFAIWFVMGQ